MSDWPENAPPTLYFEGTATGADEIIQLPSAAIIGQLAVIKKKGNSAHGVIGRPLGTDTIDFVNADLSPITFENDSIKLMVKAVGAWVVV